MRVTVIGGRGQLARTLAEWSQPDVCITRLGRPCLDLEMIADAVPLIGATNPDIVVNAAAFTDVEEAERCCGTAFRVNGEGARKVAAAAAALGIPLIHLSTDYVFDGAKDEPYREVDRPAPINAYGYSKLAGEQSVMAEMDQYAILRTSWVYSPYGRNFLTKIQAAARAAAEIKVIGDRHGAPTSTLELVRGIERVARNMLSPDSGSDHRGLFHMTCAGETTWARFAEEILARSSDLASTIVKPIPSASLRELARRPINSRLDNSRLASVHGVALAHWRNALAEVLTYAAQRSLDPTGRPRSTSAGRSPEIPGA